MPLLSFIKRIWSPYISNVVTKTHSEGVEDTKSLSERERDARILELLDDPKPTGEMIEELAKLMVQTDKRSFDRA
jgi:hypothetical protein